MARVLVIEDNPANMKLATLLLRNIGHEVLAAADAETGLAIAHSEHIDLILMDIQLPGMDGLAATVLLKQDPATVAIPVIALTAMAMKEDQEKSDRSPRQARGFIGSGCLPCQPSQGHPRETVLPGLVRDLASRTPVTRAGNLVLGSRRRGPARLAAPATPSRRPL